MTTYGCIGKKLTHSFSAEIHKKLADYEYKLIELDEEELHSFFAKKSFAAVNVTIPYKQTVFPYLDEISPIARRIGAVNTVVNRDGRLWGYNTDYHGMKALIRRMGVELRGKKVLILGTGGTCKTAVAVATDLGAAHILTVSRTKKDSSVTYEEAAVFHADAEILINTTPSGMFPHIDTTPINLSAFPRLTGVIDAVYNPLCTNLVLDAAARGIKAEGGLYMLVMQAVAAVEKFFDTAIPRETAERVFTSMLSAKENIVLTGMPGSGKSTVGKLLCRNGYNFVDTDAEIEKRCGCTIKELISRQGEAFFRDWESRVIREVSTETGCVIATGGGGILRQENVRNLKRNGKLYFLDAQLQRLCATESRPLSDTAEKLAGLYNERIGVYRSTADVTVPDLGTAQAEADYILKKRSELIL